MELARELLGRLDLAVLGFQEGAGPRPVAHELSGRHACFFGRGLDSLPVSPAKADVLNGHPCHFATPQVVRLDIATCNVLPSNRQSHAVDFRPKVKANVPRFRSTRTLD